MSRLDVENVSFTDTRRSEDTIVEVSFLLESSLLKSLEAAAREQGMTAGSLIRCLLRDFLCYSNSGESIVAPSAIREKASSC